MYTAKTTKEDIKNILNDLNLNNKYYITFNKPNINEIIKNKYSFINLISFKSVSICGHWCLLYNLTLKTNNIILFYNPFGFISNDLYNFLKDHYKYIFVILSQDQKINDFYCGWYCVNFLRKLLKNNNDLNNINYILNNKNYILINTQNKSIIKSNFKNESFNVERYQKYINIYNNL